MKVALITTPPSVRSGIGDYTRHLLPYLREHCDVQLFVEPGTGEEGSAAWLGEELRTVDQLRPRDFDQVLYQLGNEGHHAFMARMIRAIGGTVMQHDWVLFDLAMSAYPALSRGGAKGHLVALREGGIRQAQLYSKNWLDRRRQRTRPIANIDPAGVPGTILFGWHEPEATGRWTSDRALLRIPDSEVECVEFDLHAEPGRSVRILQGERVLFEGGSGVHQVRPENADQPVLSIETRGIKVSPTQRKYGDNRRLGCCVQSVGWKNDAGVCELDLSLPSAYVDTPVTLSRDRFLLPLNRSVVRGADSFIVHSDYVRRLIMEERNATTPIGILHHGAEARWGDKERSETRDKLGLDKKWSDSFLITSFGGVQPHKRIDKALEALALVRKTHDNVRLVLAGSLAADGFDPKGMVERLGLENAVRFTGFVPEEVGWDWLHAGDIALNLRGPSSGGTSGGIFQAFSFGRSVIASDAAEQRELPDSCVAKVPLGDEEVPRLAQLIRELCDNPERRAHLETEVQRFVNEECHWKVVAKQYAEYLDAFPAPRVSRRKLISLRVGLQSRKQAKDESSAGARAD